MGWEDPGSANFPTPVVGEATKLTSFAIRVMDDLTWLKSAVDAGGSGGGSANMILNGSFEAWTGGLPSGFVTDSPGQIYSGGSVTEETTDHAHGESALKITASSPSGGAALVTDFFLVSKIRPLKFSALYKASVSTVWSKAVVYWYTAAQTASTVRTTDTIWFTQSSPTSYTYVSGAAGPPSDARYAKLMIVGGDPAGTSAGSAWFDDVIVTPELPLLITAPDAMSGTRGSTGWGTVDSISVPLPILSANSVIRFQIPCAWEGGAVEEPVTTYGNLRFRMSSYYSTQILGVVRESGQLMDLFTLIVPGVSGTQTLYCEGNAGGSGNGISMSVVANSITWEVLAP